jgi:hypothetical protein
MVPMQQKFLAQGNVNFPLIFPVTCESYESAINYANTTLNDTTVLKVELNIFTSDGKCHLIIADEYNWIWKK